jgi:hypothetical protein
MDKATNTFGHYRPTNVEIRRSECRRISELMGAERPFSFLRLGDMELMFLIACQNNVPVYWASAAEAEVGKVSSTVAFGHPGLKPEHAARLQVAYENCSYLDFHDGWLTNQREFPKWSFERASNLHRNPGAEASQLFFDWLRYEFRNYVSGRRCLFAGAEAGILQELFSDPEYRSAARDYWPEDAQISFHPETRRVGEHLDAIKADLLTAIRANKVDTVFISLGGASKILCYELANEEGICAFDFGSLMRGLTYSGSDGHNFVRTVHYPFYFRVPFDVFMRALQCSAPQLRADQLLAKAHAQLAMELIRKEEGWSYASEWSGADCLDLGPENRKHFWAAYEIYGREFRHLGQHSDSAAAQVQEFEAWRKHLGLGLDGKIHRAVFDAKVAGRRAFGRLVGTRSKA